MEKQDDIFEENIVLNASLGIGFFPEYGLSQPLYKSLSRDMSDFDPIDPTFKFSEEMTQKNFLVLTKRQLKFALSQGRYFPTKCDIED